MALQFGSVRESVERGFERVKLKYLYCWKPFPGNG
jgi:hypothetical protein